MPTKEQMLAALEADPECRHAGSPRGLRPEVECMIPVDVAVRVIAELAFEEEGE